MFKKISIVDTLLVFFIMAILGCTATRVVREERGVTLKETEKYEAELLGPRKKIAVVDFVDKTKYGRARLGSATSDILLTELGKAGRFILVEREKISEILKEQEFERSGQVDPSQIVHAGKLLGVNAIVTGSVSAFGVRTEGSNCILYGHKKQTAEATVDVRVIDVGTGEIIYTETGSGVADVKYITVLGIGTSGGYDETIEHEALRAAIVKFTRNLMYQVDKKITWYCRIAEVEADKVYLDAGRESRLDIGTVLVVKRPGKEIRSPETGIVIGRVEATVGKIEVTNYFGDDGAIARVVSGESPVSGDYARLE
ncbi:MAG: CsgG/HfaB family protein [bacterium]|nr:CsgG/HfaB family protein [bacterium]